MKIEPPKTIEDFEKVLQTIEELLTNPYADHVMKVNLIQKKIKVEDKIIELKNA